MRTSKEERDDLRARCRAGDASDTFPAGVRKVVAGLQRDLAEARAERDARPEITAEDAAGWLRDRHDMSGPSRAWNAVVDALRAHAGKVAR